MADLDDEREEEKYGGEYNAPAPQNEFSIALSFFWYVLVHLAGVAFASMSLYCGYRLIDAGKGGDQTNIQAKEWLFSGGGGLVFLFLAGLAIWCVFKSFKVTWTKK